MGVDYFHHLSVADHALRKISVPCHPESKNNCLAENINKR